MSVIIVLMKLTNKYKDRNTISCKISQVNQKYCFILLQFAFIFLVNILGWILSVSPVRFSKHSFPFGLTHGCFHAISLCPCENVIPCYFYLFTRSTSSSWFTPTSKSFVKIRQHLTLTQEFLPVSPTW